MVKYEDEKGNSIVITEAKDIILKLASGRKRKMGRIKEGQKGETILEFPRKKSHIFRKADAWGLNDFFLKKMKDAAFVKILCHEEGKEYWMTVKNVKEKGQYLIFKQQGFELQLFVPREAFVIREAQLT